MSTYNTQLYTISIYNSYSAAITRRLKGRETNEVPGCSSTIIHNKKGSQAQEWQRKGYLVLLWVNSKTWKRPQGFIIETLTPQASCSWPTATWYLMSKSDQRNEAFQFDLQYFESNVLFKYFYSDTQVFLSLLLIQQIKERKWMEIWMYPFIWHHGTSPPPVKSGTWGIPRFLLLCQGLKH